MNPVRAKNIHCLRIIIFASKEKLSAKKVQNLRNIVTIAGKEEPSQSNEDTVFNEEDMKC